MGFEREPGRTGWRKYSRLHSFRGIDGEVVAHLSTVIRTRVTCFITNEWQSICQTRNSCFLSFICALEEFTWQSNGDLLIYSCLTNICENIVRITICVCVAFRMKIYGMNSLSNYLIV